MRAILVHPGQPNSIHLRDLPEPVTDVPDGRGVIRRLTEDRNANTVYAEVASNGCNGNN